MINPEPLKNKKVDVPGYASVYLEDAVDSAVKFYKRYKNDIKRLMEEQHKVWSKFIDYYNSQSDIKRSNYLDKYNDWLFDYAFSDIVQSDTDVW